jgi:broad specificity phosphatase PhoE
MKIVVVRHAPTDESEKGLCVGVTRSQLSKKGILHAARSLRTRLEKYKGFRIISSPMYRSILTAFCGSDFHGLQLSDEGILGIARSRRRALLKESFGVRSFSNSTTRLVLRSRYVGPQTHKIEIKDALAEMNFGIYDGKPESTIPTDLLQPAPQGDPLEVRFPNGDSYRDQYTKVTAFLGGLVGEGQDTIIFTHWSNAAILRTILTDRPETDIFKDGIAPKAGEGFIYEIKGTEVVESPL